MDRDALLKNLRGVSYDGLDCSVDVAISRLRKNYSITPQNLIALKPCVTKAIFLRLMHGEAMKKLFIQFYLLLFVCFLVMSAGWAGVQIYRRTRGKQSLDDLMNSSLYLMRSELREIPHTTGVRR